MPTNYRADAIACLRANQRSLTRKECEALGYEVGTPKGGFEKYEIARFRGEEFDAELITRSKRLADVLAVATADARIRFAKEIEQ